LCRYILDGGDLRCHLFLQTMRWLPSKYEPFLSIPDAPDALGRAWRFTLATS
jgi:hypothetical protein